MCVEIAGTGKSREEKEIVATPDRHLDTTIRAQTLRQGFLSVVTGQQILSGARVEKPFGFMCSASDKDPLHHGLYRRESERT